MQIKPITFVGANIEIGQTHRGLADSARQFLLFLKQTNQLSFFNNQIEKFVTYALTDKRIKCFNQSELDQIDFSKYQDLTKINLNILNKNEIPLNFGGDHSIALASIEASLKFNKNTHVIWIDAHADLNSAEASRTGAFHGMPVYYLLQDNLQRPASLNWMQAKLDPKQITYIGLRDLDAFEIQLLADLNIDYFTTSDIRTFGLDSVVNFLLKKNKQYEKIHLSFDIDSLDPNYEICTGVPAKNGLHIDEVKKIFQCIQKTDQLLNFDFVEINPNLAKNKNQLDQIYQLAFSLIQSALKPTITEANNDAYISY